MRVLQCMVFSLLMVCSAVKSGANDDIGYLLDHIRQSSCTFIRNGKAHPGQDAAEHLEMKYNRAKQHIKTTEDFIRKLASGSSISKKPYKIRCGESIFLAEDWLREALQEKYKPSN